MLPRVHLSGRHLNNTPSTSSQSRTSARSGRRSTGRGGSGNFKPSMSPISDEDKEDMLASPGGRQVEPKWLRDKSLTIGRGGIGNVHPTTTSQDRLEEARRLLALEKSTLKEHEREKSFRDNLVVGGRGGAGNVHKKKKKGKSSVSHTPILGSIASAHPILDISSEAIDSLSEVSPSRHRRSMVTSFADSTSSISPHLTIGNSRRPPASVDFYADDDQSEMWSIADSTITGEFEAGITTTRFGDTWKHFDGTPFSSEFNSEFSLPSMSSICYASSGQLRSPTYAEHSISRSTRTPNATAPFSEPREDIGTVSAPEIGNPRATQRTSVGRLARLLSSKKHRPTPLGSDLSLEKHFAGMGVKSRPQSRQFDPEIPPSPTTPLSPAPRSGSANGFASASSFSSLNAIAPPTPSMSATAALKMVRRPQWEDRGRNTSASSSSHIVSGSGSSVVESDALETDTDRITTTLESLKTPMEAPVLPLPSILPELDAELSALTLAPSETSLPNLKLDTELLPPPRKSSPVSALESFTPTFGKVMLPPLPTSSPHPKRTTTSSGRASTGRASTGRASTGRASTGRASTGRASTGRASSDQASSGRVTANLEFGFPSPPNSPIGISPSEEHALERIRRGPAACSALGLPLEA